MQVQSVELIHLDVPFTDHTNQHMKYWLPHWRIVQLCKITLADGTIGWGETIPNYTWAQSPRGHRRPHRRPRRRRFAVGRCARGRGPAGAFRRSGQGLRCPGLSPVGHQSPHVVSTVVVGDGPCHPPTGRASVRTPSLRAIPPPSSRRGLGATCTPASKPSLRPFPRSSSSTWTSTARSPTPPAPSSFYQPWSNTHRWP